jgi:hypothetical protein
MYTHSQRGAYLYLIKSSTQGEVTHMYIHTYILTCIHAYTHKPTCTAFHICTHTIHNMYPHTNKHTYTWSNRPYKVRLRTCILGHVTQTLKLMILCLLTPPLRLHVLKRWDFGGKWNKNVRERQGAFRWAYQSVLCVCVGVWVYVCVFVCMAFMYVCLVRMYVCQYIHTHVWIHTLSALVFRFHTQTQTQKDRHTHRHTHTNLHTYTHINAVRLIHTKSIHQSVNVDIHTHHASIHTCIHTSLM